MTDLPPPAVPAGWQPAPKTPGGERYWDGTAWTEMTRAPKASELASQTTPTPGTAPTPQQPPKKRIGCFGIGCLGIVAIIVIGIIIGSVTAAMNNNRPSTGGNSGGSSSNSGSGSSTDPIEQARVVLSANFGESYTYAQVKSITDSALANMGESVNNDRRSRVWSAVLSVVKAPELSHVSPMDVMRCVAADDGGAASGAGFSTADMVALCAVMLK